MSGKYDDIIDLPHPEPQTHPRMPMRDRAAQFAPFAPPLRRRSAAPPTRRSRRTSGSRRIAARSFPICGRSWRAKRMKKPEPTLRPDRSVLKIF